MMTYKKIRVDVYNADVWVVTDRENAENIAWRKLGLSVADADFKSNGFCAYSKAGDMIWLPPGASYGTIAHECAHAAMNICHRRGIIIDTGNQEPFTYLIGFLVNRVTDAAFVLWGDHDARG